MEPIAFELLATDDMQLPCLIRSLKHSQEDAKGVRFLVEKLWTRIPLQDRTAIAEFAILRQSDLEIRLEESCYMKGDNLARVENVGVSIEVKLSWEEFRIMNDETRMSLIAHEIAHIFQVAKGLTRTTITPSAIQGTIRGVGRDEVCHCGLIEYHVDEVLQRWGFKFLEPLLCYHQFFRIRKHEQKQREKPITRKHARQLAWKTRRLAYGVFHKLLQTCSPTPQDRSADCDSPGFCDTANQHE